MKKTFLVAVSFAFICLVSFAQDTTTLTNNPDAPANLGDPLGNSALAKLQPALPARIEVAPFAAVETGRHHLLWQRVMAQTNLSGIVIYQTNSVVELETGKHYFSKGQWLPAKEEIELTPDGAAARQGAHQVEFTANVNSAGAIHIITPDGKDLRTHIVGLAYYDFGLQQQVLIAELQDSIGQLVSSNQVLYTNAFTDVKADVLYTYSKAGLEQDIILRERPPAPQAYGFNYETTRLQVFTEFLNPPTPVIEQKIKRGWKKATVDRILDFGDMKIGQGRAFSFGDVAGPLEGIEVEKHWQIRQDRTFLVEEVALRLLTAQLRVLPLSPVLPASPSSTSKTNASAGSILLREGYKSFRLPEPKLAKKATQPIRMASLSPHQKGLVLDYSLLSGSTNFTFKSGTTYLVSSNVTVNLFGNTTIEGGAVIKYDRNSQISLQGPVTCQTDLYRPAIFTAIDDNSVGETLGTGIPSGMYATVALTINGGGTLSNLRISYAQEAISCSWNSYIISHSQILNCNRGLHTEYGNFTALNILMSGVQNIFYGSWFTGTGENLTCDNGSLVTDDHDFHWDESCGGAPSSTVWLFNTLLTGMAGEGNVYLEMICCQELSSSAGVYQSLGAGNYYLATNSPYRTIGTSYIDPTIVWALPQLTTYPPLILNTNITTNAVLGPVIPRDTNGAPDLGYHYPAVDYLDVYCQVTNATLTLTNGVVLAYYDLFGLWLENGGQLVSVGTPNARNMLVHTRWVQEQYTNLWSWGTTNFTQAVASCYPIFLSGDVFSNYASVNLQFTTIDALNGEVFMIYGDDAHSGVKSLRMNNCELYQAGSSFVVWETNLAPTMTFTNNLFQRPNSVYLHCKASINAINNLFVGNGGSNTPVNISDGNSGAPNLCLNNAFDGCGVYLEGHFSNNAYLNVISMGMAPEASSIITNLTWVTGPLGCFYQLGNSPLIDKGSATAGQLGLFHYTTQVSQVKETNSVIDIGYHYIALDGNGIPDSTLWLGIADYLADTKGDGDAALISWLLQYFGQLGIDPNGDPDGDGLSNLTAFQNNLNPFAFKIPICPQ